MDGRISLKVFYVKPGKKTSLYFIKSFELMLTLTLP